MKYIVFLIFTLILSSCSFESETDDLGDNFFSGNKPSENLIIFTPPAGKTYIAGEQIIFSITHPGILTVTGTPRLSLDIGGNSVFADYQNGSGTKTLTFSYTVLANDLDADGIEVLSSLDLNGGSITFDNKGVVTNTETNFNEGGFLNLVKVDAVVPTLTSIIPVALPTSTLYVGQSIEMAASFSENILITGSPTIDIDINGTTKSLAFVSGNGSSLLYFRGVVEDTDFDINGYEFNSLNLNSGNIRDAATNSADLSSAASYNTMIFINGDQPYPLEVISPASQTYKPGEFLSFQVRFSEIVNVTGTPRVQVSLDSGNILSSYSSGSGTDTLTFTYIVLSGNVDTNGIEIGTTIDLNGGSIRDGSTINAILDMIPPLTPNVLVDGVLPEVTVITPPLDGFYGLGDELFFSLTFNDTVNVTGTPRIGLQLNSSSPTPVYADYSSGSGTTTLIMRYVVSGTDVDPDGITLDGSIDLNGGLIQNATLTNADVNLSVPIAGIDLTNIIIDGADTTDPTIISIIPPNDQNYVTGQTIEFRVLFSETVVIENTPRLSLNIGNGIFADYFSGSGSSNLVFSYTVQSNDFDYDGIILNGTSIDMNTTGVIRDQAFNNFINDYSAELPIDLSNITINTSNLTLSSINPPADATYVEGDNIDLSLTYSGNIVVTGTPRVEANIGGTSVFLDYLSGSGTNTILYRYTVADGLEDIDGIGLISPIDTNSGTIQDNSSLFLIPNFSTVSTSGILVDSIDPVLTLNVPTNILANNFTSYSLNGTCDEEGATVNITVGSISNSTSCSSGLWSISNWDTTAEPDNTSLTVTAQISDAAGNSITATETTIKDSIVPLVSIVTPSDASFINTGNDSTTFTVDGSCDESGAIVNIQVDSVDATSQAGLICDGANFSGTIDTTLLISGAKAFTAIIQDSAGNTTTSTTNTVIKDATVPTIEIISPLTATFVNSSTDSTTFAVSGTCDDPAATITITVNTIAASSPLGFSCDGTNFNGTIDSTGIAEGSIDLIATIDDGSGNTSTSSTISLFKDTILPTVAITTPADSSTINSSNDSTAFMVSGSCDENGVTVNIQIDGVDASSQVAMACNGTIFGGAIDSTVIAEGPRNFTAVIQDAAGNETTSSINIVNKDSINPAIEITTPLTGSFINAATDSVIFPISGTCDESGATASITLDGVAAVGASGFSCDGTNFSGTINTTGIADSTVSIAATLVDSGGNTTTSSTISVLKDSSVPNVTLAAQPNITSANATSYNISGTCDENGEAIDINFGPSSATGSCSSGTYSINMNTTSTTDGSNLTLTVIHTDTAGNASTPATTMIDKDVIGPAVFITFSPDIVSSNETSYTMNGSCSENGDTVNITIGALSYSPVCISNGWTTGTVDVSSLSDGNITIAASQVDGVGNLGQDAETIVKSSGSPLVTIISAANIDQANETSYTVSGTCSNQGTVVTINIGSITRTANCSSSTWMTPSTDVSSLSDGTVAITADHSTAPQDSINISKDTASDLITISSASDISVSNQDNYTASGTCSSDGSIVSIAIGGLSYSLTCNSGTWSTGLVDVSSLTDGTGILVTADHLSATQATTTINKATSTPTVEFFSVATTLVNSANLNWELSTPGGFTINDYIINYRIKGDSTWLLFNDGTNTNTFTEVTGLTSSTVYEFRGKVIYDTVNESEWTITTEGETQPEDTIFGPYSAMNVGGSTDSTVTAHQDGTTITLNGLALTTLNKGQTHRFTSSQFDIIDSDKPIFTAGRRGTAGSAGGSVNIAWNPTEWAGKEFSFNAIRTSPQVLTVYAIEDAVIEAKQGSTILDTATITKGNSTTLSWTPYGSYQITSTGNILAYHISISGGNMHDAKPLIPGFTQIIGFPSNSMRLTTNNDATNFNAIHSNSTLSSGSLNKSTEVNINPEGGSTSLYQSESLLITADKKISGASFADSNGLAAGAFISTNLMKTKYIIPVVSDYIAFASKLPGTIAVINSAGLTVQTLTLTRSGGNTSAPYKVRGTTLLAGYRFEATVPVAAWYHPDTDIGAANDDETLLYGTNE